MNNMKRSCSFTGHRCLPPKMESQIETAVETVILKLIEQGIIVFNAGGAVGFDTIAAETVLKLKSSYTNIKLHLVLPCCRDDQTTNWTADQVTRYDFIAGKADSIEYVSEHVDKYCIKKRNVRLVELADVCVCYCNERNHRSGTAQTVRLAKEKGIEIINLFDRK